jgi:hypothetical protein
MCWSLHTCYKRVCLNIYWNLKKKKGSWLHSQEFTFFAAVSPTDKVSPLVFGLWWHSHDHDDKKMRFIIFIIYGINGDNFVKKCRPKKYHKSTYDGSKQILKLTLSFWSYLYARGVGRHSIPSTVALDPSDSAGSVYDVTGPESSVKAIRGADSRGAGFTSVDLSEVASLSAAWEKYSLA